MFHGQNFEPSPTALSVSDIEIDAL
eukprot:SAG31_NODE_33785_length_340_cov_0.643154_1_plen_24_part_10